MQAKNLNFFAMTMPMKLWLSKMADDHVFIVPTNMRDFLTLESVLQYGYPAPPF